ncbi:hypothetical protein N8D56_16045 [Devosia sp. A8/3-2]|nr:hypothetical protein N8D56_16045 [Devosia sp. A8/3-2]
MGNAGSGVVSCARAAAESMAQASTITVTGHLMERRNLNKTETAPMSRLLQCQKVQAILRR